MKWFARPQETVNPFIHHELINVICKKCYNHQPILCTYVRIYIVYFILEKGNIPTFDFFMLSL